VDQTQITRLFRGSSDCSTSPPSHRRISTMCPHRTFHKELQLYTWSTLLRSQIQSPLHKRDRNKAKAQTQSPLHHYNSRVRGSTVIWKECTNFKFSEFLSSSLRKRSIYFSLSCSTRGWLSWVRSACFACCNDSNQWCKFVGNAYREICYYP